MDAMTYTRDDLIAHFDFVNTLANPHKIPEAQEGYDSHLSILLGVWDDLAATGADPVAALRAEHSTYDFGGHGMWDFDSATERNVLLLVGAVAEGRGLGFNPQPAPSN